MEEKKTISIRKLAALERAKALGFPVRVPAVSPFEHQAREWKRQFEVRSPKSEVQSPRSEVQVEKHDQVPSTQYQASSIKHPVSSMNEGFDWKPYQSEQGEGKKKVKDLNPASISLMARKIMAREWAMALGRSRGLESEQSTIERGAEQFRQKKEAERERKKIEEKRANEQRKVLEEALRSFGRALLTAPKPVTPETAEAFLEAALTDTGEFISITWQEDGCRILIEPWEEKSLRRKSGENVPAVFQARIDENLMLSSFEKIQDPQLLQQTQNDLILKNILSSFRKSPRQDLHGFENAISEGGRIIRSTKMDGGWKINFEPWQEMQKRNVERKGRPPIVTYVIKGDKDFNHITCERI